MSFLIKDNEVWNKYDKIWEVIKDKLGINFYSEPVYEYKYLKSLKLYAYMNLNIWRILKLFL